MVPLNVYSGSSTLTDCLVYYTLNPCASWLSVCEGIAPAGLSNIILNGTFIALMHLPQNNMVESY